MSNAEQRRRRVSPKSGCLSSWRVRGAIIWKSTFALSFKNRRACAVRPSSSSNRRRHQPFPFCFHIGEIFIAATGRGGENEMEEIKLRLWICLTNGFIMSFIHLSQIGWGDRSRSDPFDPAFHNSQSSLIGRRQALNSAPSLQCVFAKKETRRAS